MKLENLKIILLWALLPCSFLHAQTASVTFERNKILLGEQVRIYIVLQNTNPNKTSLTRWFTIANTANHIEVIKRSTLDSTITDSAITYSQNIYITSFDSGKWQLKFVPATIRDKKINKTTSIGITNAFIEVLPVDVSTLEKYHGLKNIIAADEEKANNIWKWLPILLLTLIILLMYFFRKKKKGGITTLSPQEKSSALEQALKKLDLLKKEAPTSPEQVKPYYTELSNICYNYIYLSTGIDTLHTTDAVWVDKLSFSEEIKSRFIQLIRLCNAVKFAKYIPDTSQHQRSAEEAKECLKNMSHDSLNLKL